MYGRRLLNSRGEELFMNTLLGQKEARSNMPAGWGRQAPRRNFENPDMSMQGMNWNVAPDAASTTNPYAADLKRYKILKEYRHKLRAEKGPLEEDKSSHVISTE